MRKIICIVGLIVFVLFISISEVRADEQKTGFGIRLGNYSFSDIDLADVYEGSFLAIDLIIPSSPNTSYRISLEQIDATGEVFETEYYGGVRYAGYGSGEISITGFSVGIMGHTSQQEKFGFYGGIGLGFYSVTHDVTATVSGGGSSASFSDTVDGDGMGSTLFGGLNIALSPQISLGLELNILLLTATMSSGSLGDFDTDYGGMSGALVLKAGF